MDKEDARFQTLERLHGRRKRVVRLHRKGIGVMRIVELSVLSYPTVRGIIDRYEPRFSISPLLRLLNRLNLRDKNQKMFVNVE